MAHHKLHAFISHNSADKPAVESIAAALEAQGLQCFLDKWDILPRDQWLRNLENGLADSRTVLIFIGTRGIGPYQQAEVDAALRRQIQQRQDCIIPVLLPGASPEDIARLSLFLQGTNALRFYDLNDPLPHRILAGLVRGDDPSRLRQLIREQAHIPTDLLQTLNHWLSGLKVEWREEEEEYDVSEGQGKSCLRIPDLSASPNLDSIEYLLNWKSRLTGMFGREKELNALHGWADARSKTSIRLIIGEGGVGKTRLAFEFAAQLKQKGWQAGEAQGLEGCWYTGSSGTLLIIDYPEQRSEKVTALLEALARMPPPERRLRVLLLGRNGDFLQKLTQTAQSLVASRIELQGLAVDDSASWNLFRQAWRQLHDLKHVSVPTLPITPEAFQQWRQQADLRGRPLFILALAIRLMLDPKAMELNGKEIIRALTQQYEVIRLKKEAKKRNIDEHSLVMLRALAVIPGRLESEMLRQLIKASAMLNLDIRLPELRQIKDTSLWSQEAMPALQPDLLAADLLHYALTELAGDQAGPWQYLGLEAAADIAEASSILGRVIHDAQSILGQSWPLQNLIDWVCKERARCEELSLALNRNYLERTLLPVAIAVEKALWMQADLLQTQAPHLHNLSIRLAENGQWDAALQASQQAVAIYEQFAANNFAAYGPSLASGLNSLSARLGENGKREAALHAIQRTVAIHEQLAAGNVVEYGAALAGSLHNLSEHLGARGERGAALRVIQRVVEIREQLSQDNFVAHRSALAESLNSLSVRLDENGEREAALHAIQRTVAIYELLAADNFAAYGPVLAMSLNNLSACLANNGKRGAGLQAIQRAVAIREQLAQDNFAVYGSALAESLNNLSNDLAVSNEHVAALQAIQRSAEIREQLTEENFIVFGPGLAMSLNNLSNRLAESGKRDAALHVIQRAVGIDERLAAENFAAYGPALAMSLNNLSIRLSGSGERGSALQALQRAVEIYRRLATDNFAAHGPDFADALHHLSNRLVENGELDAALRAIQCVVEIREQLVQKNFSAYGAALARGLNDLWTRLSESGEHGAALQALQRVVKIREQLAQKNFSTHGPALAGNLNTLSNTLADNGEYGVALQVIQRAVAIYEQLASDDFATYGPELSGGLNNLSIRLGENGEREAALQVIQRAVAIRERLATDDFPTYGPDLASSLHNLSIDVADAKEWEMGLQACLRAVEIREQLAAKDFTTHGSDLAGSLNNLSIYLTKKGEREGSLQAIRRAVEIYEQLAQKNLATHGPDLAASLTNLSLHLRSSGQHGAALQVIQQAVEIYEQLAAKNFAAHGPVLAAGLHNLLIYLNALDKNEEAAETRAKLQIIKWRILNERVQVPAWLAPLFE